MDKNKPKTISAIEYEYMIAQLQAQAKKQDENLDAIIIQNNKKAQQMNQAFENMKAMQYILVSLVIFLILMTYILVS